MSVIVNAPQLRVCERCGREERWDEEVDAWQLGLRNGEKVVGNPHCLHEWDINGSFNPLDGD
jgi:hypothetical protein